MGAWRRFLIVAGARAFGSVLFAFLGLLVPLAAAAQAPVITSPGTASGVVGQPFAHQITATNSPTSYSILPSGGYPAGLWGNGTTGMVSGIPSVAGVTTLTQRAHNGSGTGTASLVITITEEPEEPEPDPEEATLLSIADAQELAWGIGSVWLIVASILVLRRAAR
jgi:hypothetical protein